MLPPILAQKLRNYLYPWLRAKREAIVFRRRSITGSFFSSNTADFHGYPFFFHGFYDWRNVVIAASVFNNRKGSIIEIGANIGTETIGFCDIVNRKGKVYAFEPVPDNLNSLKQIQKEQNHLKLYPYAVSNTNGKANFILPPPALSGIGSITPQTSHKDCIEIDTFKLDFFLKDFKTIKLITIDTEGHELLVLKGAERVINAYKPAIILEASLKLMKKTSYGDLESIRDWLTKYDYLLYKINKFGLSRLTPKDLHTSVASNWFCVPKGKNDLAHGANKHILIRAILPWYLLGPLTNK
ncbi:FkbM family methyltransferase [Aestuariivivens marinum]|uniref:FkbM family methyltransferase n=1 Tax=Aestuariivivens marinum TaxID=2913555 RepID=UPI001F5AE664|nr:FkbM family methyltransferase [Aestuariivivens marinum]